MKKFLLSLFSILTVLTTANAETYTHTFKDGELTTDGGTVSLSDIEWNASTATYIGWNSSRGIQIGSNQAEITPLYTLNTAGFAGLTIRSITVDCRKTANSDAELTIMVGKQKSEAYTLTTNNASYTFDCDDTTGDITISWSTSTKNAYYIKSISVDYTPDVSTVNIPTPEFKTPAVVYADKVLVKAVCCANWSANKEEEGCKCGENGTVIFYTLDGTDPVYEDWVNETGSTKRSGYPEMDFNLTNTTTIKIMSVRTDGDAVLKSDIAEQTYIVSRTMPHVPANEITSGNKYAIVAADSAATYFYGDKAYGYLPTKTATDVNGKYIETVECAGFTFTAVDGGYTIQDELGRYVYHSGSYTSFNYAAEKPSEGAVWSVAINDGYATIACDGYTIHYSTEHGTYGCYPADKVTENHVLPKLYMQREYPTYTITPANNSTFDKFESVIVTCKEGIAATSDLKIAVDGFKTAFTVSRPDNNTLVLTANEPIVSHNNYDISVNITAGDIILDPEVMEMSLPVPVKYGVRTIAKYTITGDAQAAVIEEVTPANGATVEQLSHFVFSFSYYAGHTDNTEITPRLHLEGSEELIALEKTITKEDGKNIGMQQAALKTMEPVLGNGTYILEIPTGYFCDGNGKDVEGITLKYIVKNDTAIEDIIANGENGWVIYSTSGVKVLETKDANKVSALPTGIYIVNGIKTIIK